MKRRVAVIGGGYGGSLVAKALDAEAEVVLIDPREAFVNVAGSLRALTQPSWAPGIFFSFDTLLEQGRVIHDRAVSVNPQGVTLASGQCVEADYLVLATGFQLPVPGQTQGELGSVENRSRVADQEIQCGVAGRSNASKHWCVQCLDAVLSSG